jgi:hypothetical protein
MCFVLYKKTDSKYFESLSFHSHVSFTPTLLHAKNFINMFWSFFFFSVNFNKIYIKKNSINVSQNFMRTREVKKKLEGSKKNCQVLLLALLHLGRPSIYLTSMMYKTVQIILKLRLPSYWIPRAPYKIIKILLSTI